MKRMGMTIIAMLVSIGAMVGCSNEGEASSTAKSPEGEKNEQVSATTSGDTVQIKLWLDYDNYAEAIEKQIEEHLPNIDIVWEKVATTQTGNKLELDGPAGIGPDLFLIPHDGLSKLIQGNIVLPIGEDLTANVKERFIESAVETVKLGDQYYGVPLSTETPTLFYNKTLLDEYGFDVAKTFEEIKAQGDIFNNAAENKFIFRFDAGGAYTMHFFLTAMGYELFGPDHNDPEAINFNTPEAIEGLKYYASMKEYLPVPYADLIYDTIDAEFRKGTVPYIITGPWEIPSIKAEADFEWGVTTMPTINGIQPLTFSGNIIACMSAYSQHPQEARQVLEYLISNEGLETLYKVQSSIPALKDATVIDGLADDEYIMGILAQAQYSEAMPSIPEMGNFWTPAETMYRSIWEGLATPEEAAQKALDDYIASLQVSQ